MKTIDGFELKEGDACYVCCQDPEGLHHISNKPRKAVYMDDFAKSSGWDFTLKVKCDIPVEVVAVWKNKPLSQPNIKGSHEL
jgi:hypothetical protein